MPKRACRAGSPCSAKKSRQRRAQAKRAGRGFAGAGVIGGSFDAFVEDHDDVRAQGDFDLDCFFGGKEMLGAVQVRTKSDAVVRHFSQIGKAEHLVAAGIRKDRMRPGHEFVQAAQLADQLVAGTEK